MKILERIYKKMEICERYMKKMRRMKMNMIERWKDKKKEKDEIGVTLKGSLKITC